MRNKVLLDLDHPKIIKLSKTVKNDDHVGMILELAPGMALSNILHTYHKVPADILKIVVCQLIDIIEYLHSKNYVYKDLKASHLFLDGVGKLTLIDLGMAEQLEESQRSHKPAGTFHSMAPEMIDLWENCLNNGGKVDTDIFPGYNTNLDLYSIGVLIFELLTGHPPFGYLQATASTDERMEYFEKTRKGIESIDIDEKLGQALGDNQTQTEEELIDLLKQLLVVDENQRLGANKDFESLKGHKLFQDHDWTDQDKYISDFMKQLEKGTQTEDIIDFIQTFSM